MLCIRVSVKGSFVGLVHKCDRHYLSGLWQQYGDELELVPVVVL